MYGVGGVLAALAGHRRGCQASATHVCLGAAGKWPGSDPREVPGRQERMGRAALLPDPGRRSTQTGRVRVKKRPARSRPWGKFSAGQVLGEHRAPPLVMSPHRRKASGSLTSTRSPGACAAVGEQSFESAETQQPHGLDALLWGFSEGEVRNLATAFLSCGGSRAVAHGEGNHTPSWMHWSGAGAG